MCDVRVKENLRPGWRPAIGQGLRCHLLRWGPGVQVHWSLALDLLKLKFNAFMSHADATEMAKGSCTSELSSSEDRTAELAEDNTCYLRPW